MARMAPHKMCDQEGTCSPRDAALPAASATAPCCFLALLCVHAVANVPLRVHVYTAASPGTVQDANVVTGYQGKPQTAFVVKDMGVGWNPNMQSDADCKCVHERISTARVVSKNQYVDKL